MPKARHRRYGNKECSTFNAYLSNSTRHSLSILLPCVSFLSEDTPSLSPDPITAFAPPRRVDHSGTIQGWARVDFTALRFELALVSGFEILSCTCWETDVVAEGL